MRLSKTHFSTLLFLSVLCTFCQSMEEDPVPENREQEEEPIQDFYFGADLSYVNQILDKGGIFKVDDVVADPYKIFADQGTNLIRLRLWHSPDWITSVYGDENHQRYSDLQDVERALAASKEQGVSSLLDFHFSDIWADPGRQEIPSAWREITSLETLQDSVYSYTFKTLTYLKQRGLMPEFVQLGNETNCGMMYSNAPAAFPKLNVCEGNWANLREVMNTAIQAVQDAADGQEVQIVLHVADPKNIDWWFENLTVTVTDFDVIGFSYYPIWHTEIGLNQLGTLMASLKPKFGKALMMLETAYPWTQQGNDNYTNLFGGQSPISGYPFTKSGQFEILQKMTQELVNGGAMGIVYWEPAWITSDMKDLWGTGSSWENCAFFDFEGNLHEGITYQQKAYSIKPDLRKN